MSGNYYETLGGVLKDKEEITVTKNEEMVEALTMDTIGKTTTLEEKEHSEVLASSLPMPPDDESIEGKSLEITTDEESEQKPNMIQVKI